MLDRLKKIYTPISTFNDLSYRQELFSLRYDVYGSIDLLSAAIQRLSSKIREIEVGKAEKYNTTPSIPSDRNLIAILIGTLPPEYDPEVKEIERNIKMSFSDAIEELRSHELKHRPDRVASSLESLNLIEITCNHCYCHSHSVNKCFFKHPELRNGRGLGNGNGNGHGRGNNNGKKKQNQKLPESSLSSTGINSLFYFEDISCDGMDS